MIETGINNKKNNKEKMVDKKVRTWLCTLNNPSMSLEKVHLLTNAVYTVGQLEKGENGTVHLQFVQNFSNPVRLAHYKKTIPQVHAEPVHVDNGVDKYCMKEETRVDGPWSYGKKPMQRNSKRDWDQIFLSAKRGRLDEVPADIRVRCYSQLKKIEKDHLEVKDCEHLRGVWIYGPSGVGKSRMARRDYPDHYPKLCNKWWDGYQGQKNVIMDDMGPEHKVLAQQLKIWSDRYGCILETKGGALTSSYEHFVVTSQYSIEEIFGDDVKTIEALKRRFKIIYVPFKVFHDGDSDPFIMDSLFVNSEDLKPKTNDLTLIEVTDDSGQPEEMFLDS